MTMNRLRPITCRLLAVLALICLAAPQAGKAAPEIAGALVRFGRSPSVVSHSWAYLMYHIRNPDPKHVKIRLSLRPDHGGVAIFEKEIELGPNAYLRGRELITPARCETYQLNIYQGKIRVAHDKIFARYSQVQYRDRLFVVNDSEDWHGTGGLVKRKGLVAKVEVTTLPARDLPHHWLGYGESRAVLAAAPDFDDMTAMQYTALVDFVQRGGTLIFLYPEGVLAAADTPLRELLPVTPLRVRLIEELPALDEWGRAYHAETQGRKGKEAKAATPRATLADPEGIAFLESVPAGDGVTTLSHSEFPVCRWGRRGLGTVGVFAVDPGTKLIRDSACYVPIWNHLLTWARSPFVLCHPRNAETLPRLLALLTGFEIPDASLVQGLLVGYLSVLGLVLGAGFVLRKHTAAWIAATALGVVMTVGIFKVAAARNAKHAAQSVSIVDLAASTNRHLSGHTVMSMFSKKDCRPTLAESNPENCLRVLPPLSRLRGGQVTMASPLVVRRVGGVVTAPYVNIQALKPRIFSAVYNLPPTSVGTLPRLLFGDHPPRLTPWPLPDWAGKRGVRAYALYRNGFLRLNVKGGKCVGVDTASGMLRLDTLSSEFEEFFASRLLPDPCLILLRPWTEKTGRLSLDLGDFEQRGYAVDLIPLVSEVPAAGRVMIPPELIEVRTASVYSRMAGRLGQWQGVLTRQKAQFLEFEALLPRFLADARIDEIQVDLEVSNPGENILFDAGLTPGAISVLPSGPGLWKGAVKPGRRKGFSYGFTGLDEEQLVDRVTGRFVLLLRASQKREIEDIVESQRCNSWKITSLRVTAFGAVGADADPETRRF